MRKKHLYRCASCTIAISLAVMLAATSVSSLRADSPTLFGKVHGSTTASGAAAAKGALLSELQTLRAAARLRVGAGYGIADETLNGVRLRGLAKQPAHRRVEFWFSRNRCVWRTCRVGRTQTLLDSTLITGGIRVHYQLGSGIVQPHVFGPSTPIVTVASWSGRRNSFDFSPLLWTYRGMTEISGVLNSDRKAFVDWARNPAVAVTKKGPLVTVAFSSPPQEKVVVVFDTMAGGMVTRYCQMDSEVGPDRRESKLVITTRAKWRRVGTYWLPVAQTTGIRTWNNGKASGLARTSIRFLKFVAAPVKEGLFKVPTLEIPPGTPVIDLLHHDQYRYLPADAALMLFREKPAVDGATSGGK